MEQILQQTFKGSSHLYHMLCACKVMEAVASPEFPSFMSLYYIYIYM